MSTRFSGDPVSNEDLLELDVDVLVPAALENVIRRHDAPRIKARIVAEGANGPRQHGVNLRMRTAAYMLAIDRVAAVHGLRGIYA